MDLEKIIKSLPNLKTSFLVDYSESDDHGKKNKRFKIQSEGLTVALLLMITIIPFFIYISFKNNNFNEIDTSYKNEYSTYTYTTDTTNTSYDNN
nr:MAG TPA: hypothetical protein [Caudoviricetes sp.]